MTTPERQINYIENHLLSNISSIDINECEDKLKDYYHILDSDSLIIFKIDIKNEDTSSTQIEYEIYNPYTLEKMNLSICEEIQIDIYPPIDLNHNLYILAKHLISLFLQIRNIIIDVNSAYINKYLFSTSIVTNTPRFVITLDV